jgi:hypothetical protein
MPIWSRYFSAQGEVNVDLKIIDQEGNTQTLFEFVAKVALDRIHAAYHSPFSGEARIQDQESAINELADFAAGLTVVDASNVVLLDQNPNHDHPWSILTSLRRYVENRQLGFISHKLDSPRAGKLKNQY